MRLVAGRLMGRGESPPHPALRPLAWAAALVALVALVAHMAFFAAVWSAGLAVGATALWVLISSVRRLAPTLAVTVVGVALGVASLQTVLAVARGFEVELTERISAFNGHVLVAKYGLDFYEYEALGARFRQDPRVLHDSPFAYGTVAVAASGEGDEAEGGAAGPRVVMIKGVLPERAGRFPGFADTLRGGDPSVLAPAQPRARPGAAMGYRLAQELDLQIGDVVVLVAPRALDGTAEGFDGPPRRAEYELRDLVETGVLELDERAVLVHLTAAQALLFGAGRVTGVELRLVDAGLADAVAADLERELNEGRHLPLFRTVTWREQGAGLLMILRQARAVLSLVLGLIIAVASSTLVMSLLLLVRRRRHDIATLSGMGTPAGALFWIFELVGLGAGALGAGAGVLLGSVACLALWALRFELADGVYPVEFLPVAAGPADALVPAAVAVAVCGLVSGPIARAAARVRTIDALRG